MSSKTRANDAGGSRRQFRLRSVLLSMVWLAMILAICVHYQRAAARQRQAIESLGLGGAHRPPRIGWQGPPTPLPAKP
jgi:hypothetical protein